MTEELRDTMIVVKMTKTERDLLDEMSNDLHMGRGEFIRLLLREAPNLLGNHRMDLIMTIEWVDDKTVRLRQID